MVQVGQRLDHPGLPSPVLRQTQSRERLLAHDGDRPTTRASRMRTAPCDRDSACDRAGSAGFPATPGPRGRPTRARSRSRRSPRTSAQESSRCDATRLRAMLSPSGLSATSLNAENHADFALLVSARAIPARSTRSSDWSATHALFGGRDGARTRASCNRAPAGHSARPSPSAARAGPGR